MGRNVKKEIKVGLAKPDRDALKELQRRECELRHVSPKELGQGTLLRELGMPQVYARLKELQTKAVRADEDRRSGEERRRPELVPTP